MPDFAGPERLALRADTALFHGCSAHDRAAASCIVAITPKCIVHESQRLARHSGGPGNGAVTQVDTCQRQSMRRIGRWRTHPFACHEQALERSGATGETFQVQ